MVEYPIKVSYEDNTNIMYKDTIKDYTSRYRGANKLIYQTENIEALETQNDIDFIPDDTDIFFEVTPDYENRLDLIAYRFYNNPLYWWIIASASNIKDPTIIPPSTILRIPNPERVFSFNGLLRNNNIE